MSMNVDDNTGDDDDFVDDDGDDGFGDDDFNDDEDDDFGDDGDDADWSDDVNPDDNDVKMKSNDNKNNLLPLNDNDLNPSGIAKKSVPNETKVAINDNVDELNMLPMFCGVPDLTAPAVLLGIKIKQFKGISRDQLAVWGLTDYKYIAVRLKFGRWYLHEISAPSIEIGATNHISDVGIELDPFRISWTLMDRSRNALFSATDWHQNIKMNDIPDIGDINDLMESTQKTYNQCLNALKLNKNDVNKTTEYLILNDNNSNKNIKKDKFNKKSLKKSKLKFAKFLKKLTGIVDAKTGNITEKQKKDKWKKDLMGNKSSKKRKIKQLSEIFNINYDTAKLAFDELGYDVASEKLFDPAIKLQYQQQNQLLNPNKNNKNKNKNKNKGVFGKFFGSNNNNNNDIDIDDDDKYDDGDYGCEYKVWDNLRKSCKKIKNYEKFTQSDMKDNNYNIYDDMDDDNNVLNIDNNNNAKKVIVDENKLMTIVSLGMGFDVVQIRNALIKTSNASVDVVVDYILNQNDNNNNNNNNNNNVVDDNMSDADATKKREFEKKRKAKERLKRMFALGPCPRLTKTASDSVIHQILSIEESLESITIMFEHNFLIIILLYILKILLNSTNYCMICDSELAYPGLKPTICLSVFCQFRLLEIGLGGDNNNGFLSSELLGNPDICDFLICFACAAGNNEKRSTIFFPSAVRGTDDQTANESFLKADGKTPDVDKLKKVTMLCPSIDTMHNWCREGEWSLKEELNKLNCLLYPLIMWVITSNRALIRKLRPDQLIKEINTPHQFIMASQTPEKEEKFNKQKLTHGNKHFYAWHGSGIYNWHSILRMGLKNYSNTKHMSAGAAYGPGIYLAENSSTSLGYSQQGTGFMTWKGSKFGNNICCMSLNEIIGDKKKWQKGSGIYVVSDENCVATRYFFLFESNKGFGNLSANNLTLPKLD